MLDSNLLTRFIETSVALSTLMVAALIVTLVVVRTQNAFMRSHRSTLTTRWRAVFTTPYTGEPTPDPLPSVNKRDWFTVLQLFVQFHDIREKDRPRAGEIFPKLDAMARETGLDTYALGLLKKGDDADKILAFNALGHLKDERSYEAASKCASDDGPELSRAAAHCALRIEPEYVDDLLAHVRVRDDWARSRVEAMLREVESQRLDHAMRKALDVDDEAGRTRLLDYVRFCTPAVARDISRSIVTSTLDVETVAAALRSLAPLAGDEDHDIAVMFSRSSETVVALSALRVLRKCVRHDDEALLSELTAAQDYWVRLRAAEVVVQLYGETGLAEEFGELHPDRYARDAIRQALAERRRMNMRRAKDDRRSAGTTIAPTPIPAPILTPIHTPIRKPISKPTPISPPAPISPPTPIPALTMTRFERGVTWPMLIDPNARNLDAAEREQMISAFGLVGDAWCAEILAKAFVEESETLREAVLDAIGSCEGVVSPTLRSALGSERMNERYAAIDAASRRGDAELLVLGLNDAEGAIALAAAYGLARVGHRDYVDLALEGREDRSANEIRDVLPMLMCA